MNTPQPEWDAVSRQGWTPNEQARVEQLMNEYGLSAVDAIQEHHADTTQEAR